LPHDALLPNIWDTVLPTSVCSAYTLASFRRALPILEEGGYWAPTDKAPHAFSKPLP